MESSALCPICCSAAQERLTPPRRRHLPSGDIVRCTSCYFVYRTARSCPWPPDSGEAVIPSAKAQPAPDEQLARQLAIIEQSVGCGAVLDIGCGDGSFLDRACRHGWQVAGVGTHAAVQAHPLLHDASIQPSLQEGDWPAGSFDAVTIWDGFERSTHPENLLRLAAYYCRLDGVLALQIRHADRRRTREEFTAMPDAEMPSCLYSPVAVHRLFSRYGFRTQRITPVNLTSDMPLHREHRMIAVARYTP